MKCPVCGAKLHSIQPSEWVCDNPDCPENKRGYHSNSAHVEWYGSTQKEINEMYKELKE